MKTGDLIMLGIVAVGGYLIFSNWPSAVVASTNPAAGNLVPANTPPPTNTSLVQVPVSQTPVAPGTPAATPTPPNPPSGPITLPVPQSSACANPAAIMAGGSCITPYFSTPLTGGIS